MVAIFVVLTIVTFLVVDLVYQKVQKRRESASTAVQDIYKKNNAINAILVPEGLFFHPGHSWASIMTNGSVRVGMDDFINKLFGGIDGVEVAAMGREVKQGDPIVVLHKNGRKAELAAPVDGVIEVFNRDAVNNPGTIKSDPYSSGWICELRPTNLHNNLKKLTIAETAKKWAREEVDRLKDFFSGATFANQLVGQTLQDGGAPIEGVLSHINDEAWSKFRSEFLKTNSN